MTENDKTIMADFEEKLHRLIYEYKQKEQRNRELSTALQEKENTLCELQQRLTAIESNYTNLKHARILSLNDAAIEETARLTEAEITLDDTAIVAINEKLYEISQHLSEQWKVSVTYFRPDEKKQGGSYLTDVGSIRKINEAEQLIIMDNCMHIIMELIINIEVV